MGEESGASLMASTNIHSTAIVDSHAQIDAGCEVGPYCVVGANVKLGEGCRLHSHVVVDGLTVIGARMRVLPVCVYRVEDAGFEVFGGGTATWRLGRGTCFGSM